jgi:hypothetical protein
MAKASWCPVHFTNLHHLYRYRNSNIDDHRFAIDDLRWPWMGQLAAYPESLSKYSYVCRSRYLLSVSMRILFENHLFHWEDLVLRRCVWQSNALLRPSACNRCGPLFGCKMSIGSPADVAVSLSCFRWIWKVVFQNWDDFPGIWDDFPRFSWICSGRFQESSVLQGNTMVSFFATSTNSVSFGSSPPQKKSPTHQRVGCRIVIFAKEQITNYILMNQQGHQVWARRWPCWVKARMALGNCVTWQPNAHGLERTQRIELPKKGICFVLDLENWWAFLAWRRRGLSLFNQE